MISKKVSEIYLNNNLFGAPMNTVFFSDCSMYSKDIYFIVTSGEGKKSVSYWD